MNPTHSTKEGAGHALHVSRRRFISTVGLAAAATASASAADPSQIPGFEAQAADSATHQGWTPVSDRRIRVGIAGYGVCRFGAAFSFQDHPNVEVLAVSDLVPERCAALAKACRCKTTYPSLEEMLKNDRIEAVFVATDAPAHARHCLQALERGKHVATAVPATFGSMDEAYMLHDAVKRTGLTYMMFETSVYHQDLHEIREIYGRGGFGKLVYSEGEYYHYMPVPIDSYKGWRIGLPPQWYPTHSNAYYVATGAGQFTEVSCLGMPSLLEHLQPASNPYRNPYGTEIATFRTSEGGISRMAVSWDTPGASGEMGRVRGQKGSFYGKFEGLEPTRKFQRPPLPPKVAPGGHGGSHGYLTNEFVLAILQNRPPLVDISMALNLTVPGIVAHQSAMKGGEWMKIPVFKPLG